MFLAGLENAPESLAYLGDAGYSSINVDLHAPVCLGEHHRLLARIANVEIPGRRLTRGPAQPITPQADLHPFHGLAPRCRGL